MKMSKMLIVSVVAATICLATIVYFLMRPNARKYEFVCKDSSGKFSIFSRNKPCLQKECSFVAIEDTTQRCYGLVIGSSPQMLNPPENIESQSIIFNIDTWGGDFLEGPDGHHFPEVKVKGNSVHAVIGDSKRQETVKFSPLKD